MKVDIHPKYYAKALIRCACGATYVTGATREKMQVEICGNCHPFYTGEKKLIDVAGRVERFKTRRTKVVAAKPKKVRVKKSKILTQ